MRTRPLVTSAALLLAALVAPGCILDNPAFDELTIGEVTLSDSDSGVSDSGDTDGAGSYGTSLSGGASAGETDSGGTTGDVSGSAGESEGTTTGLGTDGTTSDASASSTDTGDATTDTGDTTDTGETGDTTGGPESMELKHYTDGTCDTTFWCQPMGNPAPAVNLAVECFDSGLTPPYVVDRVDFQVFKTLGNAPVELHVYEYNEQFNAPKLEPATKQWYGMIGGNGGVFSEAIDPVVINTAKVCVGVLSGDNQSQLGVAANGVKPPLGQSFLGGSGSCMLGTHTDVANFMGASTWCMSAWVREE
ncbi:MAG: hypothetical protein KC486_08500 [Myxococcales bacterium]|nr:hypothetical protein [Myxococcales bacterium]